jgi:hypothetical protein
MRFITKFDQVFKVPSSAPVLMERGSGLAHPDSLRCRIPAWVVYPPRPSREFYCSKYAPANCSAITAPSSRFDPNDIDPSGSFASSV